MKTEEDGVAPTRGRAERLQTMKYGILMSAGHFEPEAPLLLAQRHRDGTDDADED